MINLLKELLDTTIPDQEVDETDLIRLVRLGRAIDGRLCTPRALKHTKATSLPLELIDWENL